MLIPSMTHAVPGYVGQSYVFNWPAVFLMPYYRIGVAARTALAHHLYIVPCMQLKFTQCVGGPCCSVFKYNEVSNIFCLSEIKQASVQFLIVPLKNAWMFTERVLECDRDRALVLV